MSGEQIIHWEPNPGPQTALLACTAYEALFGGSAGGGKTDSLVAAPLRWIAHPGFRGIIFRRTFPELEGQVIPRSRDIYSVTGGVYNSVQHTWTFPSGARIHFGHLQREDDVHRYQGWEFQFIGFDELTQFTERQYTYLLSRARSAHGLPIRIRASTNPGGEGHEWVFKRWAPWLNTKPEYKGIKAQPGEVLRYNNNDAGEDWHANGHLSRVFIPARATDNPYIMRNDPGYIDRLSGLDPVTRAQLRDGDWLVQPGAGLYFKREWFHYIDAPPVDADWVRRWDLASTEDGGDWTVGVLMGRGSDGKFTIADVVRARLRPDGVQKLIKSTAELDGRTVRIVIPQDPGQAGKAQCDAYAQLLAGYNIRFERETGDKVTRAQPFSAQVEAGNVSLMQAPWNLAFVQCHEAFPEGAHDDDVDAAAGAFNALFYNPMQFAGPEWKAPQFTFGNPQPDLADDDGWGSLGGGAVRPIGGPGWR